MRIKTGPPGPSPRAAGFAWVGVNPMPDRKILASRIREMFFLTRSVRIFVFISIHSSPKNPPGPYYESIAWRSVRCGPVNLPCNRWIGLRQEDLEDSRSN